MDFVQCISKSCNPSKHFISSKKNNLKNKLYNSISLTVMNSKNSDMGQDTLVSPEDQTVLLVNVGTTNSSTFRGQAGYLYMWSSWWKMTWTVESNRSGEFKHQLNTFHIKMEKAGGGPRKIPVQLAERKAAISW